MKKIFTLLFMAAATLTANAQSDGFYHIQNTYTGRYMVMVDNTAGATKGTTIDMKSVCSLKTLSKVNTHPGTVMYIQKQSGNLYDVIAQGTSLKKLSGNRLNAEVTSTNQGYIISGSYGGTTINLGDVADDDDDEEGWLRSAGNANKYWKFNPIDQDTHYLGIVPDVKDGDGNYWGTLYCGFAYSLYSDGMEAWYVEDANGDNFQLKQWTGSVIPATMPMLIKCSSSDPAKNKVKPVTDDPAEPAYSTSYHLNGRYFDNTSSNHVNNLKYDANTMRVIDVQDGKLVFAKASSSRLKDGTIVPHNMAYLTVPSGSSSVLTRGTVGIRNITTDNEQVKAGTYTLTGQKIPEGEELRPGIYIQNGKKVIIK